MDYKELIGKLRGYMCVTTGGRVAHPPILDAAADTIETLLAERDAAVKDLTTLGQDSGDSCHLRKHLPCVPEHDGCLGWEWRGPQKGEPHGE